MIRSRLVLAAALVVLVTAAGAVAALVTSSSTPEPAALNGTPATTPTSSNGRPTSRDDCDAQRFTDCEGLDLQDMARQDPTAAVEHYHRLAAANPRFREACHGLFHDSGYGAADGDRSLWEAFLAGTSECNWGYIHGAVERALAVEFSEIVATAHEVCAVPADIDPTADASFVDSAAGNCVHGTGHALFRAALDPLEAEAGCRAAFADPVDALNCIDGMIMEVGNNETGDSNRFEDLCVRIGADAKATCYSNIPLTWLQHNGYDFEATFARCDEAAPDQDLLERCGAGVSGIYTFFESFDFPTLAATCAGLPAPVATGCYIGIVQSGTQGVYSGATTQAEFDAFLELVPDTLRDRIDAKVVDSLAGLGAPSPVAGM